MTMVIIIIGKANSAKCSQTYWPKMFFHSFAFIFIKEQKYAFCLLFYFYFIPYKLFTSSVLF